MSLDWSPTVPVNLELRANDFTFKGYVNGSLVVTAADSEYPVGRVGIYKWALADASFDNFEVDPRLPTETGAWPPDGG